MPKEKNQHKSAAASDEKFRDFFTTTVADIPAEMVRREEEAAEEHKGLFGRLFGHAKPKPVEETLEPIRSVDVPLDDPEEPETPEKAPEPPRPTMVFAADKPLPEKKSVRRVLLKSL